jgi:hypothetical protein
MYWYRLECSLGRSSLVGTTVKAADRLPRHLVADEKHTTMAGEKVYLAATAGGGCGLVSRDPNRYEVSEPELLRGLRPS